MTGRVHDVVVVGSGIGGLTAAALCAAEGLDVLVLEGHTRPGGCAGDFVRRRILFPAGATVVMGFEPGGLHRWVYERLDLPIAARRLDVAMRVHLPDREVAVYADRAAWDVERRLAFPELGRGGERFWSNVRHLGNVAHDLAARRPTLPIRSPRDVLENAARVGLSAIGAVPALPALWQTVGGLLGRAGIWEHQQHRQFIDNQLLISMQCLSDECVALSGALALDVYRHGTFSLPAGTATIANDLVRALQAHGGAIQYHAWAQLIEHQDSRWLITTADEQQIEARAVIANLPTENVAELLGHAEGAGAAGPMAKAHKQIQPWGAVVLNAALDPTGLPGPFPRFHQVVASYDGSLEDGGSCFVSLFGPEDGKPDGPARLAVSTHTRVEPWWALADRPAYLEEKQRLGERLLRAAEAAIPDLASRIRFSEVSTPRSFWRWTGRFQGRVGGFAQTLANANLRARTHQTGRPGLVQCGDAVFPGQGTIGVTLSGIIAARAAVRYVRAGSRASLAHFTL